MSVFWNVTVTAYRLPPNVEPKFRVRSGQDPLSFARNYRFKRAIKPNANRQPLTTDPDLRKEVVEAIKNRHRVDPPSGSSIHEIKLPI